MTMTDRPLHPIPGLQEAVDGLLGAAERASVEKHVAECAVCRREFEALKRVKHRSGGPARTSHDVPPSN
jgi:anti-sigma factor RsiW